MEGWEVSSDLTATVIFSWVETSASETARMICGVCRARYSSSCIAEVVTCSRAFFLVIWTWTWRQISGRVETSTFG